jgi:hypothetical protein
MVTLFSVIAITLSVPAISFAQAQGKPSGQGLEISPPLIERSADPGQTLTLDIKLRNITKTTLVTDGSVEDFVAQGEEGQPKLLIGNTAEPSPYTFKPWVQSITRLTLAPEEQKVTRVTIVIPKDASPGGHYGVVRFSGIPSELDGTGGVSLSASLGSLVLINVSGDVVKKASIAELYTAQNNKKSGFFEQGPITFGLRVRNEGNVHIKPDGTMRVTNIFGKEVQVLPVNELGGNILPKSIRKFEKQFGEGKRLFGKYTVEANVHYDGKTLTQSESFWVIPYKQIAIALGILLLLIVIVRSGIKRYNARIIARERSKNNQG